MFTSFSGWFSYWESSNRAESGKPGNLSQPVGLDTDFDSLFLEVLEAVMIGKQAQLLITTADKRRRDRWPSGVEPPSHSKIEQSAQLPPLSLASFLIRFE